MLFEKIQILSTDGSRRAEILQMGETLLFKLTTYKGSKEIESEPCRWSRNDPLDYIVGSIIEDLEGEPVGTVITAHDRLYKVLEAALA